MPTLESERTATDTRDQLNVCRGQVRVEAEPGDRRGDGRGRDLLDAYALAHDRPKRPRDFRVGNARPKLNHSFALRVEEEVGGEQADVPRGDMRVLQWPTALRVRVDFAEIIGGTPMPQWRVPCRP